MAGDLYINGVMIDWQRMPEDSYVAEIPAFRGLGALRFKKPVTFFVGENGSGKSTLLEAMAVGYGFNPEGGTKNYSFSTRDTHSDLHDAIRFDRGLHRPYWGYFLRAETFYNVATAEEEYSRGRFGAEELHLKSHGESFLAMVQRHFRSDSIYFLDEPEAALSPQRQLTLLLEIERLAREGSQFFIVTHSPILLGLPGAEILSFDDGMIHPCDYEDTDSYRVTEMFINSREMLLEKLLKG